MSLPDIIEAGQGPTVILVHSSASNARQWRSLMDAGADRVRLKAVNMRGYGATAAWAGPGTMTLDDAAAPVRDLVAPGETVSLVGHSMGASVAMAAAARLGGRVHRLVLVEPNCFFLLEQTGPSPGRDEARALRAQIEAGRASGDWWLSTKYFCDYWLGPGQWEAMPQDRQARLVATIPPLANESDAVFGETRGMGDWAALLPPDTTVIEAPGTVASIREGVALMRRGCPGWRFVGLPEGGHMAPLTHPDVANAAILAALG